MGTSWIQGAVNDSRAGVLALRPDLAEHVERFDAQASESIGPRLRTLLEIRVAQLLRDQTTLSSADPALVTVVSNWSSDPSVNKVERAALEVCEVFLMDHHSITDDQIIRLHQLLGDQGAVAVLMNIAMLDGFTKFRRVFSEGAI